MSIGFAVLVGVIAGFLARLFDGKSDSIGLIAVVAVAIGVFLGWMLNSVLMRS